MDISPLVEVGKTALQSLIRATSRSRVGRWGSATPLLWTHAEYIKLVQSAVLGRPFDRVEPVHQRYVVNEDWPPAGGLELPVATA